MDKAFSKIASKLITKPETKCVKFDDVDFKVMFVYGYNATTFISSCCDKYAKKIKKQFKKRSKSDRLDKPLHEPTITPKFIKLFTTDIDDLIEVKNEKYEKDYLIVHFKPIREFTPRTKHMLAAARLFQITIFVEYSEFTPSLYSEIQVFTDESSYELFIKSRPREYFRPAYKPYMIFREIIPEHLTEN